MANAATAYAKQINRRQIYACTSSIGPGALNMVTAAGTATVNRIPLLLLPGDNFASRQPDPVLQQLEVGQRLHDIGNRLLQAGKQILGSDRPSRAIDERGDSSDAGVDGSRRIPGRLRSRCHRMFRRKPTIIRHPSLTKRVHYGRPPSPAADAVQRAVELVAGQEEAADHSRRRRTVFRPRRKHLRHSRKHSVFQSPRRKRAKAPCLEPSAERRRHRGNRGAGGQQAGERGRSDHRRRDAVFRFTTSSKSAFTHPEVQFLNINITVWIRQSLKGRHLRRDAKETIACLA